MSTETTVSQTPTPVTGSISHVDERKSLQEKDLGNSAEIHQEYTSPEKCDKTRHESPPLKGTERLLHELARGASLTVAAKRAGVSRRTAQRRWRDRDFLGQMLALRQQFRAQATGRISVLMADAAKTLKAALANNASMVQLTAARTVLKFGWDFGIQGEECLVQEEMYEQLKAEFERLERGEAPENHESE